MRKLCPVGVKTVEIIILKVRNLLDVRVVSKAGT